MTFDLAAWKKKRIRAGVLMMPAGVVLIVIGAALAWGSSPMAGFLVGSIGVVSIVVGALLVRQAVAGPFPVDVEGHL